MSMKEEGGTCAGAMGGDGVVGRVGWAGERWSWVFLGTVRDTRGISRGYQGASADPLEKIVVLVKTKWNRTRREDERREGGRQEMRGDFCKDSKC